MSEFTLRTEIDVLETVADQSALHVMEISSVVDEHPITVDETCVCLHNQGCIRPLGRGVYEITEKGKQRLETECTS